MVRRICASIPGGIAADSPAPVSVGICPVRKIQPSASTAWRLCHTGDGAHSVLSIKAGSLDDTSILTPTCHLWTRSAQPWVAPLLEDAVCFEQEPDSDETLRTQLRAAATGASTP